MNYIPIKMVLGPRFRRTKTPINPRENIFVLVSLSAKQKYLLSGHFKIVVIKIR